MLHTCIGLNTSIRRNLENTHSESMVKVVSGPNCETMPRFVLEKGKKKFAKVVIL